MDASLMENPNYSRSEGNLESQSNNAPLVWGPCELTANGKKRESRKCHHFSIRGYVSEVRKTNIQLCWPFRAIDNQYKVEEHADLLPPMIVTESRWWGCRSCLQKAHILEIGGQNEETINCQGSDNRRLEIGGTPFNRIPEAEVPVCVPTLLSEFQRTQGQSTLERDSIGNDILTNLKDSHLRPSLCHHEKGKISIDTGICNYGVHLSTSDAIQSLLSETPSNGHLGSLDLHNEETSASKIREIATLETHETGLLECENMAVQGQNICNTMITELEERTPGFGVSETELNSSTLPFETNKAHVFGVNDVLGFRKRDGFEERETVEYVNSSLLRSNNYDIKGLEIEEVNHGASECIADLVKSKDDSPSCPSTSDIINGNSHRRKARKVRTLNDIMKSEVVGLSRQSNLSTGNDSVQYRDERAMVIAGPRNGKSVTDINLNLVPRERESESLESMKRKELQESEDEDPSLIHWLRRIPKKLKTQKYGEEENTANNAVISSQAVPQLSDKCLRSNVRESVSVHPKLGESRTVLDVSSKTLVNEFPTNITHTGSVHSRITLQKGMNNGYCPLIEDQNAKYINTGNAPQKLVIRNDMLYSHREQSNGPQKDILIHGKKEIMQGVAYGAPSSLSALKNISGTSTTYEKGTQHNLKRRSVRGRKGPTEEVTDDAPVICEVAALGKIQTREEQGITPIKRRMSAPLSEKKTDPTTLSDKQAVIDGIPIEILELLQSNYHKNHQPNSRCPTERMIENHLNSEHSNVRIIEPFNATKTLRDCSFLKLTNVPESNPDSLPLLQHKSKMVPFKNVCFGNGAAYAVDEHTGTSNLELRARTSNFSVKQRQVDTKEVQRPAAFPDPPDVRLCLAPPSGAQPNMESTKSHFPQSYNWNRVLLQNEVSNYNALPISRQQHCRCYPHGGIQVNNSHNIHPGIYNTNLLPQVRLLENDPSKATRSDSGMQITDTSFTQLHNVKQKNNVKSKRTPSLDIYRKAGKTVKDCSSKISEPLELYTNDSIPAMHLLRLLDPAVGSAASHLDPTMSSGQEEFVSSKRLGNGCRRDLVERGEGIKARCPFKCVGLPENPVYNQTSSSNLMSAPRYGAVESLSQKRSLPGSNIFDVPYEFKRRNPTDASPRKTGGKGKKKSSLGIQQGPSEQGPLFGARSSQDQLWSILNSPDYLKLYEARENLPQVEYKHTEESMPPASGSCRTELCVVNRNPADFSIPDENNVYMISYEDLQPRYHPPKRRKQKVMHLDTPKRQKIQQKILKLAASEWNLRC